MAKPISKPGKAQSPATDEYRRSPRKRYKYAQMIAPMYHGRVPKHEEFFEVTCHDLSSGGFSFYYHLDPRFTQLAVALGRFPLMSCFSARVVHVREVVVDGLTLFQIGCQFEGRLELP